MNQLSTADRTLNFKLTHYPIPGSRLLFLTVFGHFADPARARHHVDCNPHNGKWNFDGNGIRQTPTEARGLASCISHRIIDMMALAAP